MMTHTLEGVFKHSRQEVLIITPAMNHALLKRAVLEGVKRGSRLQLVVQSLEGDPLGLAQYERVDVRILQGRPLEGSVILADDRLACTLSTPLDHESLSASTAIVRCSDDEAAIRSLRQLLPPLLKRTRAYLK